MSKQRIPMVIVLGMSHRSQNVRGRKGLGGHSVQSLHFINEGREGQRHWGLLQGSMHSYKVAVPRIQFRPPDFSALFFSLHHAA